MINKPISGFSKLSKGKKLRWIVDNFFKDPEGVAKELMSYWLLDEEKQQLLDRFSENTISNFHLPYGVAPNFLINGKSYCIPMVIEESSVVAAASNAAKYWHERGGFHAEILCTEKIGQIHFTWPGEIHQLQNCMSELRSQMLEATRDITRNMEERGGGIKDIELTDISDQTPQTYQIQVSFDTVDSMGANFINSVMEAFSKVLTDFVASRTEFKPHQHDLDIIMAILSNYTPKCLVRAWVECPVSELGSFRDFTAERLAQRFEKAVKIAKVDPYRATTHNKGIFNGIDAVVIATANDFRAVEANGHAYAAKDGQYRGLTDCEISNGIFRFWIEIPLSIGTVGGLTSLHPMARHSLELLGNPDAEELMKIIAVMGLAQNFAALRSLITTGIQKGHMKMHLHNVLASLNATEQEVAQTVNYFADQVVSYAAVRDFLLKLRSSQAKLPLS
ncbi:MAG: hydroxymethylglutaryl-CoA reductase, degradative [Saprospiraceae bacterium]|nr:hydroxymethylglutaryl-CoA reductase, degradative [Saprospiraceae bacterium]